MSFFSLAFRLRFLLVVPVWCAAMFAGTVALIAQTEPPVPPAATAAPPAPGSKLNHPPFELPGSFSADVQTTQGSTITNSRFFATDGKIRLESKVRDISVIMIAVFKEKKVILVVPDKTSPEKGVYVLRDLTPANEKAMDFRSAWNDPKVTWESMPPSAVDGVECDVYKLTRPSPPTKPGEAAAPGTTHTLFLNPATKLPLKVIIQTPASESTQLWTNVAVGPQPEALFDKPAGYVEKPN
ncbi:MAG: hypothetical protein ACAI35_15980 [Candidatus Methylacidiphilales bacterium]|nr:hypothetical protein [Candidatus Methylacidiphilales bacterium]